MKRKSQKPIKGKKRVSETTYIHREVQRVLRQIAREEGKSYSKLLAEIVFQFFKIRIVNDMIIFEGRKAS